MRGFPDKDVRGLFAATIIVLLGSIVLGQVMAAIMANDYKKEMITHDYALAGYWLRNDLNKSQITSAFTAGKTAADLAAGQSLLKTAGYDDSLNTSLLPAVKVYQQKYAILALLLSITFSVAILAILLIFVISRKKKLEAANVDILNFMNGSHDIRLKDHEEGALSQLFSSVNVMATSLTTHIAKEKHNKEFLRDTIADISHQLKTPLAALQMYNEIMQEENSDCKVVENFTGKSSNELNRMEDLIQSLLKLARLDVGAIELEKRNQNLKNILDTTVFRFATRAARESKSITLHCELDIILNCDKEWLSEAFSNLIKNALDHTADGDEIDIKVEETPVITCVIIKDSGTGIHPDDIHNIFKRFYRSRFSKDRQGIGIGLTLAKSIVEKHGASIMVESKLNQGTTFYLIFPKIPDI